MLISTHNTAIPVLHKTCIYTRVLLGSFGRVLRADLRLTLERSKISILVVHAKWWRTSCIAFDTCLRRRGSSSNSCRQENLSFSCGFWGCMSRSMKHHINCWKLSCTWLFVTALTFSSVKRGCFDQSQSLLGNCPDVMPTTLYVMHCIVPAVDFQNSHVCAKCKSIYLKIMPHPVAHKLCRSRQG